MISVHRLGRDGSDRIIADCHDGAVQSPFFSTGNKAILAAVFLCLMSPLTSASATSPTPAFFTGEALYEICRNPNPGHCSMYVAGVIDGLFYSDTELGTERLCRAKLTNVEAAEIVVERLRADRMLRELSAAVAVRVALSDKLACLTAGTQMP
ncbi:Rap1a/Tai family immunity protein [Rhizorhapis sp. SPR117]|uniref:Rap1a/Tai family immunity protein n=1 Tax=Rhizorhapis sp. SPR117 TaxID=2912611 RepID=UPI001F30B923|nr:hypothetical protein [Rhizorhapis sp. SPR117]